MMHLSTAEELSWSDFQTSFSTAQVQALLGPYPIDDLSSHPAIAGIQLQAQTLREELRSAPAPTNSEELIGLWPKLGAFVAALSQLQSIQHVGGQI